MASTAKNSKYFLLRLHLLLISLDLTISSRLFMCIYGTSYCLIWVAMGFWRFLQLFKISTDILPQRYPLQVPWSQSHLCKPLCTITITRQTTPVGGALIYFRFCWLGYHGCFGVISCLWVAYSCFELSFLTQLATCQLTGLVRFRITVLNVNVNM